MTIRRPDASPSIPRGSGTSLRALPGRTEPAVRDAVIRAILSEEGERAAVAGALHDGPIQLLTAVGLRLGMRGTLPLDADAAAELQDRIDAAIAELRRIVRTLRDVVPGDGLGAALRRELDDAARRASGLRTRCVDRELDALPTTSSCALVLRIVHSAIAAALDAAPVSELEAIVEGGSTVATTLRIVSDDRDATQETLAVRLRDWLATVDHVDGAWTLTRGSRSVALSFAVPADL